MKSLPYRHITQRTLAALLGLLLGMFAFGQNASKSKSDIPAASRIQSEELMKLLKSDQKPLVLYVGPRAFYQQAHVPGAEFIGPTAKAEGLGRLRSRTAGLPRGRLLVIYCGCCPWTHCPNIRPAYRELKKMGFRNLRVLYLATSFGRDWAGKGYPVTKGD